MNESVLELIGKIKESGVSGYPLKEFRKNLKEISNGDSNIEKEVWKLINNDSDFFFEKMTRQTTCVFSKNAFPQKVGERPVPLTFMKMVNNKNVKHVVIMGNKNRIKKTTEKAVLFDTGRGREQWIPKSVMSFSKEYFLILPEWFWQNTKIDDTPFWRIFLESEYSLERRKYSAL